MVLEMTPIVDNCIQPILLLEGLEPEAGMCVSPENLSNPFTQFFGADGIPGCVLIGKSTE
jgi:hypothetical protein